MGNNSKLRVIIASVLEPGQKEKILGVLKRQKREITWKVSYIKGISSSFCTHKILMENEIKPKVQPQRRLNLNMIEVVKEKSEEAYRCWGNLSHLK